MEKKIYQNELRWILIGSTFLGSGGGGKIKAGKKFLKEITRKNIPVSLLTHPLSDKEKSLNACIVCDIGSIEAFADRQSEALDLAFTGLSSYFKQEIGEIKALFPIETGPENTFAPLVLAARRGLYVVDADGAGRAIPIIPLCSFAIGPIERPKPVVIANDKGDVMSVFAAKTGLFDKMLRSISQMDGFSNSASLAMWPETVAGLLERSVPGSITRALACGCFLENLKLNKQDRVEETLKTVNEMSGYLIGKGTVIYKESYEEGAFNFTRTKIKNELDGDIITVLSQNESLIVFSDKKSSPLAFAPDSICFLNYKFEPYTNAEIDPIKDKSKKSKQNVLLIAIKADSRLYRAEIKNRFRTVLEEHGYSGSIAISQSAYRPLGDLLIDIQSKMKA